MIRKTLNLAALPARVPANYVNSAFDYLFYDVPSLSPSEQQRLLTSVNLEGSILIVPPTGGGEILPLKGIDTFSALTDRPRVLTVAGVGSSDLGAAAFARNMADGYGETVAAIVPGYGFADLVTEALGGWFLYGAANHVQKLFDDFLRVLDVIATPPASSFAAADAPGPARPRRDDEILLNILSDPAIAVDVIVGHSKGCLSIAEALFALQGTGWRSAEFDPFVVTVGAVVEFPRRMRRVRQFLGGLDTFGGMNSRFGLAFETIPAAWHHLNRSLPFACDLPRLLRSIAA